ncbi:MAG: Rab family GTPase [Thermoplasmata archaeon]
MTSAKEPKMKLKICLVGEAAVGKTSLIRRFVDDAFEDRYIATLGAKVIRRELRVRMPDSGKKIHTILTVWDILGHGGFRDIVKDSYFRGAQGILAVCDVTRPLTMAQLEGWKHSVWENAGEIPAYVLANKADLAEENRLEQDDLEAFCEGWGCPYLFTSAKTGRGVDEAFRGLTGSIVEAQRRDSEALAHKAPA